MVLKLFSVYQSTIRIQYIKQKYLPHLQTLMLAHELNPMCTHKTQYANIIHVTVHDLWLPRAFASHRKTSCGQTWYNINVYDISINTEH